MKSFLVCFGVNCKNHIHPPYKTYLYPKFGALIFWRLAYYITFFDIIQNNFTKFYKIILSIFVETNRFFLKNALPFFNLFASNKTTSF